MMDLSPYIRDVKYGLGDIAMEYYDDKLALNDLKKAYKFIYMIVAQNLKDEMDANNLASVECCLISLSTYYAYRTYTVLASDRLGTMPESSPVQLSYLMEDARNCLTWISMYPLDENMMPIRETWASYGAIKGPTVVG
jgi:hypothetical protein